MLWKLQLQIFKYILFSCMGYVTFFLGVKSKLDTKVKVLPAILPVEYVVGFPARSSEMKCFV